MRRPVTEETVANAVATKLNVPVIYRRIPVTDRCAPTDRALQRLRGLWTEAISNPGSWVHCHCHGGDGRTTTFLALYDMLCWKRSGDPLPSREEFARRRCRLFDYCLNPNSAACWTCQHAPMARWRLPLARALWQALEQVHSCLT